MAPIEITLTTKWIWTKFSLWCGVILIIALSAGCSRESMVQQATREQVLLLGNGPEPQSLDPHISTGTSELNIHMALFEGLVAPAPGSLKPEPGVARHWTISEDGLIYRFELRSDAKWSNGQPVTAFDFSNAYQRILSPDLGAPNASLLYVLAGAESFNKGETKDFSEVGVIAESAHILELRLRNPVPFFLNLIMHPAWFPLPTHVLQRHKAHQTRQPSWTLPGHHVGNGPFRLKSWHPNEVLEVVANEHYWDAATVSLKGIRFYPIADVAAEERAFQARQLHLTEALPPGKVRYYRERAPELLRLDPYLGTYYILLNTRREPLDNPKVRRALSMSLQRADIVENLLGAGQIPAFSFTPATVPDYQPPAVLTEDAQRAREILAEAGFEGGQGFPPLTYMFNTSESHRLIAEAIQEIWRKELGVTIQLQNQEWRSYLASRADGRFDLARAVWIGDYLDAHTFLSLWTSDSGNNFSGWSNPDYDALILKSEQTRDIEERYQLLAQAEILLLRDNVIIPLYFYVTAYLKHPDVHGWESSLLDWHPYKYIRLQSVD